MPRRFAVLVAVVAVAAAACGGGTSLSSEEQAIVAELATAMNVTPPEDVPADLFTDDDARCWSESLLKAVGIEAVRAAGFGAAGFASDEDAEAALESLTASLTPDTAATYINSAAQCLDFAKFLASDMTREGVPGETASCVAGKMVDADGFVDFMVVSMFGEESAAITEDEITVMMYAALSACMSPEDLAEFLQSNG